jgi:glutamate-1-semialdehyde 2,1-aminomutase
MTEAIPERLTGLVERERARFRERTPASREIAESTRSLVGGVPMPWMLEWPNPYPLYAAEARGARLWDADGNEYVDFCLGDTGAMFGHSPEPVVEAVRRQAADGTTTMLPSSDAGAAADLLADRFGLPHWQLALSATDANRFVLRLARALTGRPRVLVFNGCYHGSLDESLVGLDGAGRITKLSPIDASPAWPAEAASVVVEFNDAGALERALSAGDVAAVLAEPIMTNCGMVLPEEGYHDALRDLTRRHGTYLVIDETHTLSTGYGGYTGTHGLEPDFLVFGKAMAGGIPIGGYGFTASVAEDHRRTFGGRSHRIWGALGIGGTLAANALSIAALRATLERVATPEAFDHMLRMGAAMTDGLDDAVRAAGLPWSVTRAGARAELQFMDRTPRSGGEALAHFDWALVEYTHLFLLNRGVVITPFHNMMLTAPATTRADVNALVGSWSACMEELAAIRPA